MRALRDRLQRHRLVAYCALTFAISWGGILLVIGPAGIALDAEHVGFLIGFGYVGMLAGPAVAGIVLTAFLDGRAGLRALGAELFRWRVGGRWWTAALLTAPLSIAAVLFALSLSSSDFLPRLLVENDRAGLLGFVAVTSLLTGVFEELGWTGFAASALIRRHGVLRTGIVVGLLTAAWNLPIVTVKELSLPTPGALPLAVLLAVSLLAWQPAYRVLLVWVYDRTRSVLLAMLMQTSLVAAWTSLTPLALSRTTLIAFYLALTAVWVAVAMLVLRRHGRELSQDRSGRPSRATGQVAPSR